MPLEGAVVTMCLVVVGAGQGGADGHAVEGGCMLCLASLCRGGSPARFGWRGVARCTAARQTRGLIKRHEQRAVVYEVGCG